MRLDYSTLGHMAGHTELKTNIVYLNSDSILGTRVASF